MTKEELERQRLVWKAECERNGITFGEGWPGPKTIRFVRLSRPQSTPGPSNNKQPRNPEPPKRDDQEESTHGA